MKAELLRSIVAAGKARKVGDVVELSKNEYDFLASRGLVKKYNSKSELESESESELESESESELESESESELKNPLSRKTSSKKSKKADE